MGFRESLDAMLRRHEGIRLRPYQDSLGYWTVGYGHKLQNQEWREEIHPETAAFLLSEDIAIALNDLDRHKPLWRELPMDARIVVANMCFNLGWTKFSLFKRMWAALEQEDYQKAADEMQDSNWWVQTKNRAVELRDLMLTVS